MRSRAVWALLLLACATQKPQAQAQSTAQCPPPPVQAPAEPRTDDQICQADGFDFAYPFIEHNGIARYSAASVQGPPAAATAAPRRSCCIVSTASWA